MTYHCPKSCNTCAEIQRAAKAAEFVDDGNEKPCMDDHHQCSDWAGQGECNANPAYMMMNCKRACMICAAGT